MLSAVTFFRTICLVPSVAIAARIVHKTFRVIHNLIVLESTRRHHYEWLKVRINSGFLF